MTSPVVAAQRLIRADYRNATNHGGEPSYRGDAETSSEAHNAIAEAGRDARQNFADTVEGARKVLLAKVHRLVGGDNPELAARLRPMLDRFGYDLDSRVVRQTSELLVKAAKQSDPDDPTSPMAKHTRELQRQQETLSVAWNTTTGTWPPRSRS